MAAKRGFIFIICFYKVRSSASMQRIILFDNIRLYCEYKNGSSSYGKVVSVVFSVYEILYFSSFSTINYNI